MALQPHLYCTTAGTDAKVSVHLYGATADAGPFMLDNPKNNFEQGATDTFNIDTPADLGTLKRLKIWTDGAGFGSAWHLDTVVVTCKADGRKYWFYCGSWLDSKHGLERMLDASDIDIRTAMVKYKVGACNSVRRAIA